MKVRCINYGVSGCVKEVCSHGVWHRPKMMLRFNQNNRTPCTAQKDVCYTTGNPGIQQCKPQHTNKNGFISWLVGIMKR